MIVFSIITDAHGVTLNGSITLSGRLGLEKLKRQYSHVIALANIFTSTMGKTYELTIAIKNNPANILELEYTFNLNLDDKQLTSKELPSILESIHKEYFSPLFIHTQQAIDYCADKKPFYCTNETDDLNPMLDDYEHIAIQSETTKKIIEHLFDKNNTIKSITYEDNQLLIPEDTYLFVTNPVSKSKPEKVTGIIDDLSIRYKKAVICTSDGIDIEFTFPKEYAKQLSDMQGKEVPYEIDLVWISDNPRPVFASFPGNISQQNLL